MTERKKEVDFQELVNSNPKNCSLKEYQFIGALIQSYTPCNVLVFGVGYDSPYWIKLNQGGMTWFLENSLIWANRIKDKIPEIQIEMVNYTTKRLQWRRLMNQAVKLALCLPDTILNLDWDVIFVDAPLGSNRKTPGRMQSIYSASRLNYKHILVHDCNRKVERKYFKKFIGEPDNIIDKLFHKSLVQTKFNTLIA